MQNRNQLVVFAPSGLTDYPQTLLPTNTMYHGGSGLITFNGIPKAAYSALMMLSSLSGDVISEGDGYLLTRAKMVMHLIFFFTIIALTTSPVIAPRS